LLTKETGYTPISINLDKLDEEKVKKMKLDEDFINELRKLKTEEQIAKDIIKDFQQTGWRLLKKNG